MKVKLKNVVFAYDGDFKYYDGVYYSGGGFPSGNWSRYLEFSQTVTVAARAQCVDSIPENGVISSRDNVTFTQVPNISGPARLIKHYKRSYNALRDVILVSDLVVVRLPSEIGLLAIRVCKNYKKPYAIELVGDVKESMRGHGSLIGKLYSPIVFRRTRKAVMSSPACIYVTRKYLQHIYPCNGVVGHASNVNIKLEPLGSIEKNIISRGKRRAHRFGLIGSLKSSYKGVDVAINAISLLKKRGVIAHLYVLGSGDPARYVKLAEELFVSELVHFDGVKSSFLEVCKWLDGLDYYVQPSKTEGLPRALIEAMARGLPAIGSDRGGIPELLKDDCIFDFSNCNELVLLMQKFVELTESEYVEYGLDSYQSSLSYDKNTLDGQRAEFWRSVLLKHSLCEG